jgi:hypothetical protein
VPKIRWDSGNGQGQRMEDRGLGRSGLNESPFCLHTMTAAPRTIRRGTASWRERRGRRSISSTPPTTTMAASLRRRSAERSGKPLGGYSRRNAPTRRAGAGCVLAVPPPHPSARSKLASARP